MGREIKRVPLDFSWPLRMPWKGYVDPYHSQKCLACDGTGYNPETKRIADDWYDFEKTGRRWEDKITQDEVDALIAEGRLMDFTHRIQKGKGWVKIEPQPIITADMVNAWSQIGLGHDAINRFICVETRAKRLGVWGYCTVCSGDGEIWTSEKVKILAERWYDDERYDPPMGEGWQVWETVSDGSPISPVFKTDSQCVEWLAGEGYSEKAARAFVKDGWVMSAVTVDGILYKDIESAKLRNEREQV